MVVSRNVMWGLVALAAGAGIAAVLLPPARSRWMNQGTSDESDRLDDASEDSFPASDPPSQSVPTAATTGPVT